MFGSGELRLMNAAWVPVPGLTQTFTVPQSADVYLATDGGVATTSAMMNGVSIAEIALSIDGSNPLPPQEAGYRRVIAANTPGVVGVSANWSLSKSVALTADTHTVQVLARWAGGSTVAISGAAGSLLQGQLTVIIVKK